MIAKKMSSTFFIKIKYDTENKRTTRTKKISFIIPDYSGCQGKKLKTQKSATASIGWLMKSASLYQPSISTTEYFLLSFFFKYIFGCPEKSFSPMSSSKDVIFLSLIYPPPWE